MSDTDVYDQIAGGGGATARFPIIGAEVEGTILRALVQQATEFQTNKPVFWPSGDPKMETVFVLQTGERDPELEDDDGIRRLYVSSRGLRDAVASAFRNAGVKRGDPLVGGTLKVRYSADGIPANAGVTAPKIYLARFTPPTAAPVDLDDPEGLEEPF